jgi:hypothetical protein
MKKQFLNWLPVVLISALALYACQKELSPTEIAGSTQQLSLYLSDDPARFDKVFIDIQKVEVMIDTCRGNDDDGPDNDDQCKAWYDLKVTAGVYDLLTLRNGVDTLLANANVPEGGVRRIRISLGTNNSVVKDSVTYPLNLLPGASNQIVLKMGKKDWDYYDNRRCRLWLDFDINRSIVVERNGQYYLRPYVRPFVVARGGNIEGRIVPDSAKPLIRVWAGSDTAYALPNRDGRFKIRGLKAGNYNMFIDATAPYADSTIGNITVEVGKTVKLGEIKLRQ